MANMSYCRFQNTLGDLRDCQASMEEDEDKVLSREEAYARIQLLRTCIAIVDDFGDMLEDWETDYKKAGGKIWT